MARFQIVLNLAVAIVVGVALGAAVYTFLFARGFSYLSNDPATCVNCHVMRPEYDGWQKASHHAVATCNDCHIPHSFPMKWIAKGLNGYHHSRAFTLQDYTLPIQIKPGNAAVLNANCRHCHADYVREIDARKTPLNGEIECTRCHANVGHSSRE